MSFHDGHARGGPVVALTALADVFPQIEILVGDGVRKFMREHRFLALRRSGFGDEEFLAVVIVKSGGLFREQIHRVFGQVVIRGDQPEFLQRQLLGAQLFRRGHFLDPFPEKVVDLFLGDEVAGNGMMELHAGDGGEFGSDLARLAAELRGCGRFGPRPRADQEAGQNGQ
ncbi:MAG: hypothetical protein C5B51_22520 [Terriglobia bacterium]|nr:MAG: hypothetical protein C5B51_22520 [Terriglobia bacterium]